MYSNKYVKAFVTHTKDGQWSADHDEFDVTEDYSIYDTSVPANERIHVVAGSDARGRGDFLITLWLEKVA